MSGQDSSEEKTLPPSAKKLRDARKKGQIARSKELVTAAVTITAFFYLGVRCVLLFGQLLDGLRVLPALLDRPFDEAVAALSDRLAGNVLWAIAPFIGLIVMAAVLTNVIVNGGALAAFDPILPKMEHLDPIAGFKRMFGMKNLVEVLKSIVKLAALGGVSLYIIAGALQALVELPTCGLRCVGPTMLGLLQPLLVVTAASFLLVGLFDIGLQRWLFQRDMRMTTSEQKRERKESDGDPLIQRKIREDRRSSMALKTGLRNATFIIRSADMCLAMRFAAPDAMVPVLVARGTQEGALALLEEAKTFDLPVVFDPVAVAVASRLQVGRMITQEMFQPVIGCMRAAGLI
ncbi:EscU/YscU/HrcU family type III secretion system export apparatus switch protein [Lichenihabitans psoromatis]|uniref:EscU/YscU/HrcU family type III secretion system export apparatus switch protein n=1 Tax=Lichenihabitans psoromatis TaxID=2528642 RepID=UPI0010384701|nr:EscU/YscU/HrcU family type III secretion system export apparatus switch protein [Lichenihabitans psoromatis]